MSQVEVLFASGKTRVYDIQRDGFDALFAAFVHGAAVFAQPGKWIIVLKQVAAIQFRAGDAE